MINKNNNNNNIPYLRNKTPSLLTLSAAAIALMLLASPLLLSNFLLQPVQASSIGSSSSSVAMTFRTTEPASGFVLCSRTDATLTFDAQGTPSSSNPQRVDITGGTFQISDSSGRQILYGGNINNGRFANSSSGGGGSLVIYTDVNQVPNGTSACASTGDSLTIDTGGCSTSNVNRIEIGFLGQIADGFGTFEGAVECSSSQVGGEDTTAQQPSPSSSMTGTTTSQSRDSNSTDGDGDSDSDGIPDSSDNCPNHSHHRCFKEGDNNTTSTTTHQQSSSNRTGNQTG